MPGKLLNLAGRVFGRLTAIRFSHQRQVGKTKVSYWCCRCACIETCHECHGSGCVVKVQTRHLMSKDPLHAARSCGCSRTDPERKRQAARIIPKCVKRDRAQRAADKCSGVTPPPAYTLTPEHAALLLDTTTERVNSLCDMWVLNWRNDKKTGERKISKRDVLAYQAIQRGKPERCDAA